MFTYQNSDDEESDFRIGDAVYVRAVFSLQEVPFYSSIPKFTGVMVPNNVYTVLATSNKDDYKYYKRRMVYVDGPTGRGWCWEKILIKVDDTAPAPHQT